MKTSDKHSLTNYKARKVFLELWIPVNDVTYLLESERVICVATNGDVRWRIDTCVGGLTCASANSARGCWRTGCWREYTWTWGRRGKKRMEKNLLQLRLACASNSLQARCSGIRIPVWARFTLISPDRPWGPPASCKMGTGFLSLW